MRVRSETSHVWSVIAEICRFRPRHQGRPCAPLPPNGEWRASGLTGKVALGNQVRTEAGRQRQLKRRPGAQRRIEHPRSPGGHVWAMGKKYFPVRPHGAARTKCPFWMSPGRSSKRNRPGGGSAISDEVPVGSVIRPALFFFPPRPKKKIRLGSARPHACGVDRIPI
jgi:hypothetical protein